MEVMALSPWQQQEFAKFEQQLQQRSSLEMFERLAFKCYDKCVSVGYYSGVVSCISVSLA